MGVTLRNKRDSLTLQYQNLSRLRVSIAGIYSVKFKEAYLNYTKGYFKTQADLDKLLATFPADADTQNILSFLFQSDIEGKISVKACRSLYNFIKDYDDDLIYGYRGPDDPIKFCDFKNLIQSCIKNRWILSWA